MKVLKVLLGLFHSKNSSSSTTATTKNKEIKLLQYNEPFILIFQNRHIHAVPKKEILIKNINVIDVKVSHSHCIILDNLGKVYYLKNELKERFVDKFIDGDASCQPQLINFTIEDPIIKIFGKNGDFSILLSKNGNIYVLGNDSNDNLQIYNCLKDGIKFKKELIYNENVIDVACGESYFLLLTESGKVFGIGSNFQLLLQNKIRCMQVGFNFSGTLGNMYKNFTEIDLKKYIGNNHHIVFSNYGNNDFELKARVGVYYAVLFATMSCSKTISEIFNFKNCWKINDVTFIL
ncbi:hypothetical protein ABK040_013107 [Willaertia magna]